MLLSHNEEIIRERRVIQFCRSAFSVRTFGVCGRAACVSVSTEQCIWDNAVYVRYDAVVNMIEARIPRQLASIALIEYVQSSSLAALAVSLGHNVCCTSSSFSYLHFKIRTKNEKW